MANKRKITLLIALIAIAIIVAGVLVISCTNKQEDKEGKRQSGETEVAEAEVKDGLGEAQEEQIKRSTSANEVTVTTDKTAYRQGEAIKITITNGLRESIFSYIGSGTPVFGIEYIERKTSKGEWERLFAQYQSPDFIDDIDAPVEIKPGQSQTFEWHPWIFIDGPREAVEAPPGQYRLLIGYGEKTEWKTIYTNEFKIR